MAAQLTYDLFISYANADYAWVEGFLLPELGLPEERVMTKEEFRPGADKVDEFVRVVTSSRYTVLVFSPAFLTDVWTTLSRQIAAYLTVEQQSNRLIPLWLRPCTPSLVATSRVALDCLNESSWENEVARLRTLLEQPEPVAEKMACPYPGMRSFREQESKYFYGREPEIQSLLQKLRGHPLVAVIGPSGSGKSSLIFAGLVPALKHSSLFGAGDWLVRTLRPGERPMEALAAVVPGDYFNFEQNVAKLLEAHPHAPRLLLIVDQFEELFTIAQEGQIAFQQALVWLAKVPSCFVVLTLRADFYGDVMGAPIWGAIREHREDVSPFAVQELRQAIMRPAEKVGVFIEPLLVERLVHESIGQPGILPFLQETMVLLWGNLKRRYLPTSAYQTLTLSVRGQEARQDTQLTGLQVAIARRADAALATLPPEQKVIARRIFLRLIQFGEGRADTRRQQRVSELRAVGDHDIFFEQTLRHLAEKRLLTLTGQVEGSERQVDIAHEALITGWPTLRQWISERREAEQLRRRLEAKAAEWVRLGQDRGGLLDQVELLEVERWLDSSDAAELGYNDELAALVKASRAAQKEAAAQQRRITRFRLGALGAIAGLVIAVLVVFAVGQSRLAEQERNAAATAQVLAENEATARENAEGQTRLAQSQAKAAEALFELTNDNPDRALLLTLASVPTDTQNYPLITSRALRRTLDETLIRYTLKGHTGEIKSVAWSPDGSQILTGSGDGTARIWDAATGQMLHLLSGHLSSVGQAAWNPAGKKIMTSSRDGTARLWETTSGELEHVLLSHLPNQSDGDVAWDPSGRRILTAGDDGVARIWEAETGELLQMLEGHDYILSVAWSPNGQLVLTSGLLDDTVRIWEAETGQLLHMFAGDVWSVAWSSDGQEVLTSSYWGTTHIWDAKTWKLLQTLTGHRATVNSVAWSPDKQYVLTGSNDNTARIWDATTGTLVHVLDKHTDRISSVAYHPDGQLVLTGSNDDTARVWNAITGELLYTLSGHTSYVWSAAWSPNGQKVLTGSWDGTARIWDTRVGKLAPVLSGHSDEVWSVAWHPDGELLLTSSHDGTVRIWDATTNELVQVLSGHMAPVLSVAWHPDKHQVLTGNATGTARLWEAETGELIHTLPATDSGAVNVVAWHPNGQQMLTAGREDYTARIWDAVSGELRHKLAGHTYDIVSAVWSPDGQRVLTGSLDGTARIWSATTGQLIHTLTRESGRIYSVAWHPEEQLVLTGGEDGMTRIWNAQTGELQHTLAGHAGWVNSVVWHPAGQQVLTSSADGTARIWDAKTGESLQVLAGHAAWVSSVAWRSDGKQVLTSSHDGTARIWDVSTGEVVSTLEGHTGKVWSAAWSPDGQQVLTGSSDQTARLWIADNAPIIAKLTERICNVFTEDEIRAEMPEWRSWRGCEAELEALADDLAEYNRLRSEE